MTMTNPALIDAVRMRHNSLFVTSGKSLLISSGRCRRQIRATTETNTEGSVCEDEIITFLIMREVARVPVSWRARCRRHRRAARAGGTGAEGTSEQGLSAGTFWTAQPG